MKKLALAATAAAFMTMAAPASAATIIPVINSPFTAPGQVGGFFHLTSKPDTYDFTFSLTTPLKAFSQMQVNGVEPVSFSLYKGAPGLGTLVFSSGPATIAPSFSTILGSGSYYLQTVKLDKTSDLISGAIAVSAVPEPATWAMMILGFFGIGSSLRASRRRQPATA